MHILKFNCNHGIAQYIKRHAQYDLHVDNIENDHNSTFIEEIERNNRTQEEYYNTMALETQEMKILRNIICNKFNVNVIYITFFMYVLV